MTFKSMEHDRALNKLGIMLTVLRGISPTMSIQVAHSLLLVALNPNVSLTELSKSSGYGNRICTWSVYNLSG